MRFIQIILIIIIGICGFVLIKYEIEPWVKDTMCENLVKCSEEGKQHLEEPND